MFALGTERKLRRTRVPASDNAYPILQTVVGESKSASQYLKISTQSWTSCIRAWSRAILTWSFLGEKTSPYLVEKQSNDSRMPLYETESGSISSKFARYLRMRAALHRHASMTAQGHNSCRGVASPAFLINISRTTN